MTSWFVMVVVVAGAAVDLGAGVEERLRDGGAEPAVGAGDECGCTFDLHECSLRAGEERERPGDELLVVLEDAAVAGVGVDDQLRVRQALRQVDRVAGGDHPVALAVGDQRGLVDDRQVGGRLLAPAVDGLELGDVGPQRDPLVAVARCAPSSGPGTPCRPGARSVSG